jgi:hypothetical protein
VSNGRPRPGIVPASWSLAQASGSGVSEDEVEAALEPLFRWLRWAYDRAAGGELVVELCVCGAVPGQPRRVAGPTFRFRIHRYYYETIEMGSGTVTQWIRLPLGIYRIQMQVYDEPGSVQRGRRTFAPIESDVDLRKDASTLRCVAFPSPSGAAAPDPSPPEPYCELTTASCRRCG